jgi:DNA-binding XRE family transcriptional regulator
MKGEAVDSPCSARRANASNGTPINRKKRRGQGDIRERFGFAVKLRGEELGLTQEDQAEKAGIHRTYLSDIERGSRNVSLVNVERIAVALALALSELFRLVERS